MGRWRRRAAKRCAERPLELGLWKAVCVRASGSLATSGGVVDRERRWPLPALCDVGRAGRGRCARCYGQYMAPQRRMDAMDSTWRLEKRMESMAMEICMGRGEAGAPGAGARSERE